jgi:hypothetical protein
VHGFSRMSLNGIIQKVGELTHHDTITGTSLKNVVVREANDIIRNLTRLHTMTGEEIMNQALNDEGLKASTFRVCVHDLNDKRTCPDFSSNVYLTPQDSNILWVVYNPSLQK